MLRKSFAIIAAALLLIVLLAACQAAPRIPGTGGASTSAPGVVITVPAEGGLDVTPTNQGQTIKMKVGQSFLLKLGEDFTWTPTVADQSVLSRVKNIAVIRGAQGVYQALAAGTTTLSADGEPACRQSQPACAQPNQQFSVKVVVEP